MNPVKITNDIWWVGVQDPKLRIFDVIMETKWGTSYNSYLIKGSEKTVLIDSVKNGFFEEQIEGLREICEPEKIDYIVCNHTEPDHSGSLSKMMELAPNAVVVCSRPAKTLIKEIINHDFECIVVGDGDTLSLGNKTLRFISAPFLHWPDTIFTYVEEDAFLSTCDAFGFHYSAPKIFDDLTAMSDELCEAQKYYFDVIMSPFKPYVLEAIEKIKELDISVIAPSHGPVLRDNPQEAVDRYRRWAQPIKREKKLIYIGYVSCYGYTTKLAEQVALGVMDSGLDVQCEDIGQANVCEVAEKVECADGFALGSPTLNRDVLPPVWNVMTNICSYVVKGKQGAVFGGYGWSGEACKYMTQRLENLGVKVVGEARAKLNPNEAELKTAYELGKELARAVSGE